VCLKYIEGPAENKDDIDNVPHT